MPPFVLWRSAGAAKVGGFDPIWAIDCYNYYITYSVVNPPPVAAGADERHSPGELTATETETRGADERMQHQRACELVDRCGRGGCSDFG